MDAISYSLAAKQAQRIKKFVAEPDSASGLVTVPSVIANGETVSIPAGRTLVHPNLQVDGTLAIDGTLFIPSGGTYTADEVNTTVVKQNGSVVVDTTQNQTIGGTKTFTSSPVVPTPTTDMQAATKKYVDDNTPILPDATSSIKGIDYKGLLAEYTVSGSAVTSIDFSGLDINTHKSYRVEVELVGTVTSAIYLFVNGNTTLTNYYRQYFGGDGASIVAARANDARVIDIVPGGSGTSYTGVIQKSSGYFSSIGTENVKAGATTMAAYTYASSSTFTVTNITQLTFTSSVASAIGIGSKIRIYRGDV